MNIYHKLKMTCAVSVVAIFAMGVHIPVLAQTVDKTGGRGSLKVESPIKKATVRKSAVASGGGILWDTSHGILYSYSPSGSFSGLSTLLSNNGLPVVESSAGVTNVDLGAYSAVVVSLGSSWNSAYTAEEGQALQNYVNAGGALLIMSDNTDTPNSNLSPVANLFGVTLGASYVYPLDLTISSFSGHPIFAGVSNIYMRAAGSLAVAAPSSAAAWASTGEAMVSTGTSKVIVLGDINIFDNDYIVNADNQTFALNVFSWLASKTTKTVSGSLTKVKGKSVVCSNLTSGESVTIDMSATPAKWDCESTGLRFNKGDSVKLVVKGAAK